MSNKVDRAIDVFRKASPAKAEQIAKETFDLLSTDGRLSLTRERFLLMTESALASGASLGIDALMNTREGD